MRYAKKLLQHQHNRKTVAFICWKETASSLPPERETTRFARKSPIFLQLLVFVGKKKKTETLLHILSDSDSEQLPPFVACRILRK